MKPVREIDSHALSRVKFVCTDIDDTVTKNGKLGARAYTALWALTEAGVSVIPITGRPAGWCDLIARQWPVEAVIGENGAFAFYLEQSHLKHMYHPTVEPTDVRRKLDEVRSAVLEEIPGARVAKDQFSRMFDLAIDFREEPPDLGFDVAQQIASVCERFGAIAKISSIHVNTWFGTYSKLTMLEHYLSTRWNIDSEEQKKLVAFCGDSPNDEPLFSRFPLSCAVANIRPMLHLLNTKPKYVTSESHGEGFAELAEMVLKAR